MSFETQEGSSTCGLASLRFAFSLLGAGLRRNRELEEQDVRACAKKSAWRVLREGMSENDLRRAGKRLGLTVTFRRFLKRSPKDVIDALRTATSNGHPCIVCVHDDDDAFFHWIVVAGFSGEWTIVFDPSTLDEGEYSESTYWLADDSGNAKYAPGLMKVSRLAAWIDTTNELAGEIDADHGGEHHLFLEVAVAPDRRSEFVPGLPDEGLIRRMRYDLDLARHFDQYIDDLRDIFGRAPWSGEEGRVPAHEFLERNRGRIDDLFATWTLREFCSAADLNGELENLIAICRCYRFSVPRNDEARVWSHLSFYLGWRAAELSYAVGKFEP